MPTTLIDLLEGPRFTHDKHGEQGSPLRRRLEPKVGGIATAMSTLGGRVETLPDVTITVRDCSADPGNASASGHGSMAGRRRRTNCSGSGSRPGDGQ